MADLLVFHTPALPAVPHRTYPGVSVQSVVDGPTGGALEVKLIRVAPGAEIALHTHERSAETFYILSGEGVLQKGDQTEPCPAGTCVHAKPGAVHGVKNAGQSDLQLLAVFTPPQDQVSAPRPRSPKVIVTVRAVNGTCHFGHKVGDQISFDEGKVDGRICLSALSSLLPNVFAMRYGAEFPWLDAEHKDVTTHACPDARNPVVFELKRMREPQTGK